MFSFNLSENFSQWNLPTCVFTLISHLFVSFNLIIQCV